MRFAFANAKSIGTPCLSDQPLASATGWLPVASALAPARITAWALPTSQTLYRITGSPGTCSAANASNFVAIGSPLSKAVEIAPQLLDPILGL